LTKPRKCVNMKKMISTPQMIASNTQEICSTREAANLLGVSLRTVQLWVENGELQAWKTVGGHRRVSLLSVKKLMQSRQATPASARQTFRVLILEDDPDLLKLYRLTMEGWDMAPEVLTATNGFEGLIEVGKSNPDLLITDLRMPGMDGFELIRRLTASPRHSGLHIVAVSGLSKTEIQQEGGLPKSVTVFPKPVPFPELESLVRGLMIGSGKASNL